MPTEPNVTKWKRSCSRQGKKLVRGYNLGEMCVPKPYKTSNSSERDAIKKLSKTKCEANPNAYWRGEGKNWVPHHCADIKTSPVKSRLFEMWNDKVAKAAESVCLKDVEGNDRLRLRNDQQKYCRSAVNYIRKNNLARAAVSEINVLDGKVNRGEITSDIAIKRFKRYLNDSKRFRGLPKFDKGEQSWVTAYGLMEEARLQKKSARRGKEREMPKITEIRSKYGEQSDKIMKEIRSDLL